MTAAEIRQSFLDFFTEKQHTVVPSASLLPQSPGLLFTNAGMNQFVPYFLGTENAPYSPPRAADTQKCIRAGGKHNDLEDVGYDTYHHTLFEMLGNWSFGDYFKKEAIEWAWELVVERWGLPANRLYATVYAPSEGDPSEFDQEAYDLWAALFKKADLDPAVHIVNGNVKDNFWMMGETGPCGPCSELHVDMTPNGDTGGKLVNMDSDLCIEIWNLVFIQYNAEADGTFRDLPARHVDTGMGFERVASLIQNTKSFTDFSQKPTNYATDVFQPIFRQLENLSGKTYTDIYPGSVSVPPAPKDSEGNRGVSPQPADSAPPTQELKAESCQLKTSLEEAIAFRVIADHIRTLSFSIADGILPGNTGRNYVLRRILRRAVKYGRTLGFTGETPFLPQLVDTLVHEFSPIFPELKTRAQVIKETLTTEENSFNKTLDRGLTLFESVAQGSRGVSPQPSNSSPFPPEEAFKLYDTFGFPLDLTALLCRERGISLDEAAVETRMEQAREVSRSHIKTDIVRAVDISTDAVTEFLGFDQDTCEATILEIHDDLIIPSHTVLFTEMGGQEGDQGSGGILPPSTIPAQPQTTFQILSTQKIGNAIAHLVSDPSGFQVGQKIQITLDRSRRSPIESHHTATHLLHWALHEVVSPDATQQGSSVSPDRLRFDFNSKALTPQQVQALEEKVNTTIQSNDSVSWTEVPHADIKDRSDIMQFFGDKYGDLVRVVQIGGENNALNGYSMELCGGTHVRNTSDIGLFKIKSEGAIASGVRRIEALCGPAAEAYLREQDAQEAEEKQTALEKLQRIDTALEAVAATSGREALQKFLQSPQNHSAQTLKKAAAEAEKSLKKAQAANAARQADNLLADQNLTANIVISTEGPAALLQELLNGLKKLHFSHASFLIVDDGEKLHLGSLCGEDGHNQGHGAGNLIKDLAPLADGKGGGKPDMARGAAPTRQNLPTLLEKAQNLLK